VRECFELNLSLPARSENLARIRRAVADFAASVGAGDNTVGDVKLAVNEACSNVVRHAYERDEGEMEVEARPVGDYLVVVVHDRGQGLTQRSSDPGAGFGLRVAKILSDSIEILDRGKGTEVRMSFQLRLSA
jgi:serine/threonine-protein kinase RsbW